MDKKTNIDAIRSLVPDTTFGYNEDKITDWDISDIKTGKTQPSEAEIKAELVRLQAEFDALNYSRARAETFPELSEQLDLLFHDMTSGKGTKDGEWYKAILKAKT